MHQVKCTFSLRWSSYSESNHYSVTIFVIQHTESIHGTMQELMKRQKSLMMKNQSIICHKLYV